MTTYALNPVAVDHARRLIEGKQYVLDSDWGDIQPDASAQNAYLERHGWEAYAVSSPASTARRNGATRTSSSRRMICCSTWTSSAPSRSRTAADRQTVP